MHQVRITGEAQQRVWWYVQKDRTLAWRQMHLQSPRHFEKVDYISVQDIRAVPMLWMRIY